MFVQNVSAVLTAKDIARGNTGGDLARSPSAQGALEEGNQVPRGYGDMIPVIMS